jgi:uncharacterized protein
MPRPSAEPRSSATPSSDRRPAAPPANGRAATIAGLRRAIAHMESQPSLQPASPSTAASETAAAPRVQRIARRAERASLDGFVRRVTGAGVCSYMERRVPLSERYGAQPLDELRHLDGETLALLDPAFGEAADLGLDSLLFLDIETTGLGGAGAIAFLVCTGRIEGWSGEERDAEPTLVLRQYLALSPAEEGALLDALLDDAGLANAGSRGGEQPLLVTYNGRGFDAPFLDGRATMHRRRAGFESLPHLDLLAPARLLFRGLLSSCRLSALEVELLDAPRPEDEVPGAEVAGWYFHFLRRGDARALAPLARHNEQDVIALVALAGRFAALATGAREASAIESLSLGRLFARRGAEPRATRSLERAAAALPCSPARDEALTRLAQLHKRAGRHAHAEPLWQELAARRGTGALRSHVELAMYYEHRMRDLARAAATVREALALVEERIGRAEPARAASWRTALQHRARRIEGRQAAAIERAATRPTARSPRAPARAAHAQAARAPAGATPTDAAARIGIAADGARRHARR